MTIRLKVDGALRRDADKRWMKWRRVDPETVLTKKSVAEHHAKPLAGFNNVPPKVRSLAALHLAVLDDIVRRTV